MKNSKVDVWTLTVHVREDEGLISYSLTVQPPGGWHMSISGNSKVPLSSTKARSFARAMRDALPEWWSDDDWVAKTIAAFEEHPQIKG